MSNINKFLANILSARYGKDVRQSIHDAIKEIDNVADTAQNSATKSAASALASETSAKASMESANTSEQLAKQYMESAFAGTPNGYAALVSKVGLMDITTTTENTVSNTKHGGLRFTKIKGNTIRNGTPSLITPIPMLSMGECVELMQGRYLNTTGVYDNNALFVCNKNTIPCKSGDVIKLSGSKSYYYNVVFYGDSGYLSHSSTSAEVSLHECTVPSGATKFTYNVGDSNRLTPDTVGKITLTINGKYVVGVATESHQLFDIENMVQASIPNFNVGQGIGAGTPLSDIKIDESGNLSGKTTTYTVIYAPHKFEVGEPIYINNSAIPRIVVANADKIITYSANTSTPYTPTSDFDGYLGVVWNPSTTVSGILLACYDPTITTFGLKGKTTAYILTNEPPRLGDVVYKDSDGLWKLEHNVAEAVFDGSDDEGWNVANTSISGKYRVYTDKGLGFTCVNNEIANIMCTSLIPTTADHVFNALGGVSVNINGALVLYDENYNTSNVSLWEAYLQEKQMRIIYPLATPIIEVLDPASQIALNSLETFYGVTYIEFDSRVQPLEFEAEVGLSNETARLLKSELRNDTLEVKLEDAINTMLLLGA